MTSDTSTDTIRRACEYLESRSGLRVTLDELGRAVGLSPHYLQRRFVAEVGVSPTQYLRAIRTDRLKRLLHEGKQVTRASYEAGFGAPSRLYDGAADSLGMTPATYRRGGRGARIRFATTATPLGLLLIAATESGVCAAQLGDSPELLERALGQEFPHAEIAPAESDHSLHELLARIGSSFGAGDGLDGVHLDIDGTEFQMRVWRALRGIPRGESRTYTEVAEAMGAPKSVRAVARACAGNRVALLIPCHRVVRADGSLGGYRWGIERKRALLEKEGSPT
jgi:AraC family transcriptional regulator, regulatory protein of adaptative response / methylated-DNA-[protein]-cysteine methyltransferase